MEVLTRYLDIQEEVAMMRNRLEEEEAISSRYGSGRWAFIRGAINELSQKGMRNRVFLVLCAFTLANMSGASAINYYSPTLFSSLGITDVSLYTGIYGLVKGSLTLSDIVNASNFPITNHSQPLRRSFSIPSSLTSWDAAPPSSSRLSYAPPVSGLSAHMSRSDTQLQSSTPAKPSPLLLLPAVERLLV